MVHLGWDSCAAASLRQLRESYLINNYEWIDNRDVIDVVNVERDIFVGTNCLDARIRMTRHLEERSQ